MNAPLQSTRGAIDCDVHVAVPNMQVLLPYLSAMWREHVTVRGIDDLELTYNLHRAPLSARPDWRPAQGKPGSSLQMLTEYALEPFGTRAALLNCLWGAPAVHAPDLSLALCQAVNDWIAKEWLDKDARLRASLVVPFEYPEMAAQEIERWAGDKRFVQVLLFAMCEAPLGRRSYWPIYEAAERHSFALGIHAGSTYRHAPTSIGWPSYYIEDYVSQAGGFQNQLLSLFGEGVFVKFPKLKAVLIESGVTWLPGFLWRADKTWRGLRLEIPWADKAPTEVVREHVRVTMQPLDAPADSAHLAKVIEQIGCDDMFLFATDYPHWHFEGLDAAAAGLSPELCRKMMVDNPLATYPRLRETLQ